MDFEKYFDMWSRPGPAPQVLPAKEPIASEGVLWDPDTGLKVGNVFVSGYTQARNRTFSRYSRHSRFMSEVMSWFTNDGHIHRIMRMFDTVLARWKKARSSLERVYFLNVKCVLFMICERLNIPPPFPKSRCLRDLKRFERQNILFEQFV